MGAFQRPDAATLLLISERCGSEVSERLSAFFPEADTVMAASRAASDVLTRSIRFKATCALYCCCLLIPFLVLCVSCCCTDYPRLRRLNAAAATEINAICTTKTLLSVGSDYCLCVFAKVYPTPTMSREMDGQGEMKLKFKWADSVWISVGLKY